MLDVRSESWPPNRVRSVALEGGVIRVETLGPGATLRVPEYAYMLPFDIRLPGVTGSFVVEARHFDSPEDPQPRPIELTPHSLTFFAPRAENQALILEAIPARPAPEDEIVLVLDRQPLALAIERGQGVLRLAQAAGSPRHPGGWRQAIGRLPAGTYRVQLYTEDKFDDELELVVAPGEVEPPEPPLLAGEFAVTVTWSSAAGESGEGRLALPPSRDSALYYFFSPETGSWW